MVRVALRNHGRTVVGENGKSYQVSSWLIIVTGLIYLYIGLEQGFKGNMPMAIVYTGYAFSNVGLYIMAK